jgi:AraC-like DNA-binding protein
LDALYKVCVSLLPVAAGYFANKKMDESSAARSHYLLRQILEYVNSNIANGELSPLHAAQHVGISVRYVHKLFAASGTTFSAYVMSRRLDHVRRDLSGPACGRLPIFVVAYRWGFNDLSTFIRAFKKRFGCSPSRFRATA